jgi:hypothetical protein
MKLIKKTSLLVAVSLLFVSIGCQKDAKIPSDALAYVPATSTMVTAVNLKNLMQKADFESLKKMEFYQDMTFKAEKNNPEISRVLLNPEKSGIDLDQKMYVATDIDRENPETMTTYFLFSLKNAENFANLFKDHSSEITEKDGIKMIGNNADAMLAWNDELAVFAFGNNNESPLPAQISSVFKPDPANGISKNADLMKAIGNSHDVSSWMSTDQLAENDAAGMALNMIDIEPEALKGNYIHSYGDFENGKITGHSEFFITKDLGEKFIGRFFKKEVKTDFTNVLPGQNLTFVAAGAMDLRGIDQFLSERPQSKDYADFVLNDLGMKRKDLIDIFGGDMLVAGYRGGESSDDLKILVATDIKSKQKAQEFLDLSEKQGKLKKIEAGYYKIVSVGNEDFSITRSRGMGTILLQEDKLLFSTNNDLLDQIKSGKFEKAGKETLQFADNQTVAVWMDFNSMTGLLGGTQGNYFKNVKFNINGKGADFIMETQEPGKNSLTTIFQMMNEAYKQRESEGDKAM